MKKLSLFLAFVFLFSSLVTYPYASQKKVKASDTEEIEKIKSVFNIKDNIESFNISENKDGNTYRKRYNWIFKDKNSITIVLDGKGNIINYFSYNAKDSKKTINVDKDLIVKKANEYLEKINPQLLKDFKLESTKYFFNSGRVNLFFSRYYKDIKFLYSDINMEINLSDLSLFSFNISGYYEYPKMPEPNPKYSLEDAAKEMNKLYPLRLYYSPYTENKAKPVYGISQFDYLDADTLKPEKNIRNIRNMPYEEGSKNEKAMDTSEKNSLSPEEEKGLKERKEIREIKDAIAVVKDLVPKNLKLTSSSLSKMDKEYVIDLDYSNKSDYRSFILDGKNLNILSYYKEGQNMKKANIDKKTALNLGKNFYNKYSSKISPIDFNIYDYSSRPKDTRINFYQVKDNIPILNSGLDLSIANGSKEVIDYNISLFKGNFDKIPEDIKPLDEALKAYYEKLGFGLVYTLENNKPKLVYGFTKDLSYMNPKTLEVKNAKINYENLESSKYKNEIAKLADFNIGIKNADLTRTATEKDLVFLLMVCDFSGENIPISYENFSVSNSGFYRSFEGLKDDRPLKLSVAAKNILKARGMIYFEDIKNLDAFNKDLFKSFKDGDLAYLANAYALGLFEKDEISTDDLKLDYLLHIIYNLMNNFKG